MAFATIDGLELFFTDEGSGNSTLLFVHGFACDSHDWSWQLAHFARRSRVIALDLRGHGRSGVPIEGYEPLDFATDIARLLDLLGCPPVIAVGHSMGALVVSALAVEHPEKVCALVAVDPGYLVDDGMVNVTDLLAQLDEAETVPFVQSLLGGSDTPSSPPFLRTWHRRRVAGVPTHVLVQTLKGMAAKSGITSLRGPGQSYLAKRRCPVLSVYAEPSRVAVEAALFSDPRSEAAAWNGTGHWLHQERPEAFNAMVESWLETLDLPSADRA
jgi:pimeloyl-ACP methyl ester carboxylesterase